MHGKPREAKKKWKQRRTLKYALYLPWMGKRPIILVHDQCSIQSNPIS